MSKLDAAETFDVFQLCLQNMRRDGRSTIPRHAVALVGAMLSQLREPRVISCGFDLAGFAMSADGATIVSGSDDKTVRVWNAKTGACEKTL